MIVYLDTNVYIGAGYQFSTDKFARLRSLIACGDVTVIYSSATQGEVEQHIYNDIRDGVKKYNRLLRKNLSAVVSLAAFDLDQIDENQAVTGVKDSLNEFLSLNGVTKIDLNPLDAEGLMQAYFTSQAPFETKKPCEFKDAIMINAVKQYQKKVQEQIMIISNDDGFRKAFEGDSNFITVPYLGELIKICNQQEEEFDAIVECFVHAIEQDAFYELIYDYFWNFDIDRGYYGEWECHESQIDLIGTELDYLDNRDGKYLVTVDLVLLVIADITHRDEDTSYFDRENGSYLIENCVTWRETHRIETSVTLECVIDQVEDAYAVTDAVIVDDRRLHILDLDEGTMESFEEIELES